MGAENLAPTGIRSPDRPARTQGTVAGLRGSRSGLRIRVRGINVHSSSWVHPASYSMGTGGSFLGIKRPEREVNHVLPFSAEIKSGRSNISTPAIRLQGVDSNKFNYFVS
jgi:hypothetical protein